MYDIAIKHYGREDLERYATTDSIASLLRDASTDDEKRLVCHGWLADSMPKRMVFEDMFGSLLAPGKRRTLLDVGGGLTGLTKCLARTHDYRLVDLLAHDDEAAALSVIAASGVALYRQDWLSVEHDKYDFVLANDIFPNVDQRLELFLKTILPHTGELRVLLTYYNNGRFYKLKRVDADEIMFMSSWTGEQTASVLSKALRPLTDPERKGFLRQNDSLYSNGRLISLLTVRRATTS
jgi:hypothetical protein